MTAFLRPVPPRPAGVQRRAQRRREQLGGGRRKGRRRRRNARAFGNPRDLLSRGQRRERHQRALCCCCHCASSASQPPQWLLTRGPDTSRPLLVVPRAPTLSSTHPPTQAQSSHITAAASEVNQTDDSTPTREDAPNFNKCLPRVALLRRSLPVLVVR